MPETIPIRRRDRAEDDAWIEAFLRRVPTGVLALSTDGGDPPHLNSNLFVFDSDRNALFFHTARVGATRDLADRGASVPASFHAFAMGRLLPDSRALEFSVEYESVTAKGTLTVVMDPSEAERVLQTIMDKYAPHLAPHSDYEPATAADLKRTSVFRLDIESWGGKRKEVPRDFPGAYDYDDVTDGSAARRRTEP